MSEFRQFKSTNNLTILVGRNSKENSQLTFKIANPNDIFFHASDFPGSHVILQLNGSNSTKDDLLDAACLAAFYSKGKNKSIIRVDYTERRNISKPRNAPLGLVELSKFQTIRIDSSEKRIDKFIDTKK